MFLLAGACVLWLVPGQVAGATPGPRASLAIMTLDVRGSVPRATAQILTEAVTDAVRRSQRFSTVMSADEIESMLSLEKQRQMLDCSSSSCIAEIAGALDVDQALMGSVSRLGRSYLLTLKLVDVRHVKVTASVSERIKNGGGDELLDVVPQTLERLFAQMPAAVERAVPRETAPPPEVKEPLPVAVAAQPVDEKPAPKAPRTQVAAPAPVPVEQPAPLHPLPIVGWALGGVAFVAAGFAVVSSVLLGGTALTLFAASLRFLPGPVPPLAFGPRMALVTGGGVGAAVLLLSALGAAAAGAFLVGGGVAMRLRE